MLSSTSSEQVQEARTLAGGRGPGAAPPIEAPLPVGDTPLVADRERRGEGGEARCCYKLEAFEPSGHLTDRVAAEWLAGLPSQVEEVVFGGVGALAASVAALAVERALQVTVFYAAGDDEALRLRELLMTYGARVRRTRAGEAPQARARAHVEASEGQARLCEVDAAPEAGRALGRELTAQLGGEAPGVVVLPPEGAPLVGGLREALGAGAEVCVVVAPGPVDEAARATRQALGRQGVLISPTGAAVVAEAWARTDARRGGVVIAVLPDGGHRHLAWGWRREAA